MKCKVCEVSLEKSKGMITLSAVGIGDEKDVDICMKCMERLARERYQAARERRKGKKDER